MLCAPEAAFSRLAAEAYTNGYAAHGEIGLPPERLENRLRVVVEKHLCPSPSERALVRFFGALHSTDLYLTEACAQSSDAAWRRFDVFQWGFIVGLARSMSRSADEARELASDVKAHLFLQDTSGESRIASFDGRQSLATWLRVVISRRAMNRNSLRWNRVESLGCAEDLADSSSTSTIDAALRRSRYEAMVDDCLREAFRCLTDRERLIFQLKYNEGLRVVEIARGLSLHPTSITRALNAAQLKLRKRIISILALTYHLGPEAIQECIAEILENPAHSPLMLLNEPSSTHKKGDVGSCMISSAQGPVS